VPLGLERFRTFHGNAHSLKQNPQKSFGRFLSRLEIATVGHHPSRRSNRREENMRSQIAPHPIESLGSEEVRRLVAEAVADGSIMSIADGVATIVAAVPRSGLSRRQIGDELMMAAVAAGIAVEIGPRRGELSRRAIWLRKQPAKRDCGRPFLFGRKTKPCSLKAG